MKITNQLSACAKLCTALVISLTLGACASMGGGGTPQEQVNQRAGEYWKSLVAGEFTRAYSYTTPGFRAVVSADGFRGRIGSAVVWVGSEVVKVNCPEPVKCTATVRIDYKPALGGSSGDKYSTHIDETWLLEDGQWWIFQALK